ncbi:uncharacterized protein LOC122281305 [Carya illinoinensis]|uniref:uncharacterized protein LOC122281305 n=1 Tax=Carya illinoinensis TaxID=32201 RepID=UPI001C71FC8D|nr:uncharacterized protein LOC122281305 [Carya illinoinensis]
MGRINNELCHFYYLFSVDKWRTREGLSTLINGAEAKGELQGVAVARGGKRVTHLLFADDCIIFGKACWKEWRKISSILKKYEQASGQCLNKQKTSIIFSSNGRHADWDRIVKGLGGRVQNNCEKYLGLPTMVGRSKYNTFRCIKQRVWLKINNWKNNFLSHAGKEVLLKAVIQSIPTYVMSVFSLPKKLCKELAALMSKFWWGQRENENKIKWMSWAKMGVSKNDGGLGFRELESFNQALLAKQLWIALKDPDSLAATVLKNKYFSQLTVLEARLGNNPSLI